MTDDMRRTASGSSHNSVTSTNSETPLNILPAEPVTDDQGTTFFLLDVNNEPIPPIPKKSKHHRSKRISEGDDDNSDSSHSSSSSSGSSVSAQVVIDHGGSIPRRLEKNGFAHLLRSGDDESESDYAFCYTPASRRESDAESASNSRRMVTPSHLHLMEPSHSQPEETDLSAAENDGDDDLEQEEISRKPGSIHKERRRRHRHHRRKDLLSDSKAMVTVYTEEDDDLVDEMPRGDRERMLRHNERSYRHSRNDENEGFRRRSIPRRLHKRTQRVLQSNLQSHSWSRRESLQSNRHPGLSSEEALR